MVRMVNKNRNRKKQSHSRYSLKKGKRPAGLHSQYVVINADKKVDTKPVVHKETDFIPKEEKKKPLLRRFQMRQKDIEAKKLREKKIEKASQNLEKAKTTYALVKSDYVDNKDDIKSKIKQLKQDAKQQKKALKEAKKSLKASKKEMKLSSKKHLGVFTSVLAVLLFAISTLLYFVVQWLIRTWPNLKMDELMYEATAPLEGTGSNMIDAFIQQAVVPMSIAVVVAIIVIVILTKAGTLFRRLGKSILVVVSCVCMGIAGTTFWNHLDVGTYVENQTTTSDFIKDEYVDPSKTQLTFPEKKRNLIYIYCESMEMSFADQANGGARDENVIPRLTALAEENEDFSGTDNSQLNGGYSMPSTTWTMGGIFAATAGLPLQTDVGRNTMSTQSTFFPGITTLGDILENAGYNQTFSCGSPVSFGGRELYLQEHGNYTFHDYEYAQANGIIPRGYYVWWGFEDARLFEMAKSDITNMASSGQPFNYTLLTVDTHLPVNFTEDVFTALDIQDDLQTLYTSGTVFHAFLGERLSDWKSASALVRKIAENYKLPYYTLSPTYSICKKDGYLNGEVWKCPKCGGETEVYSRITGYYRPVKNWNAGKNQEFKDRTVYEVEGGFSKKKKVTPVKKKTVSSIPVVNENNLLFTTKTCTNCKMIQKLMNEKKIPYLLVDGENNPNLVKEFDVMQAPTLVVVSEVETKVYAGVNEILMYIQKS